MPRKPRPWNGSLRALKGWILLSVKDSTGKWVERSTGQPDTPAGWVEAERIQRETVEALHAREAATGSTAAVTVSGWAKKWLPGRIGSDKRNDESRLRLHVLSPFVDAEGTRWDIGGMVISDVKPRHLDLLARRWKAEKLAPRTRRNVYSVVSAMFRDAVIAGLLEQRDDPCVLTHRQIGKIKDSKGFNRAAAIYSRDEMEAFISDERIPLDRRCWYALLGIGMLRTGEAAGLRWAKVVSMAPLSRLVIDATYEDGETKTETARYMPVHPTLAAILAEWKIGGWARTMGRPPKDDDLVCPVPPPTNRGPRRPAFACRDDHWARKRLLKDLATLGLRHRRAHDFRRTGISLAQDDGADRNILRWGTHAAPTEVMDLYTSLHWETVCREVAKLKARMIRAEPGKERNTGEERGS